MFSLHLAWQTKWIVVVATALAVAAMGRYPGGTALDTTTIGYSLSHNFLSDLGMTIAYNHEPNRLGAALFVASLLLLVVGLGTVVGVIARFLAVDADSRRWAVLAIIALLAVCVAFAGVAVTPENQLMSLHVSFTKWAWRIAPRSLSSLASLRVAIPGCAGELQSPGLPRRCCSVLTQRS